MSTTGQGRQFGRRGFIGAAIVVGIILMAAIIVIVTSLTRGEDHPVGGSTGNPAASPSGAPASATRSVCGLAGFQSQNTLTAPPTNQWKLVGTVAAPTDPTGSGPGQDKDGFRNCYSHTAEGALFAAVNYVALASDARNVPKLSTLLAPGRGKDAAIASATAPPSPTATRLQVAGFKVNAYSAHEAVIDVAWAVTSSSGSLVSFPTVLDWVDGDWKIVLTDKGLPPFSSSSLQSLGGYIAWSGV